MATLNVWDLPTPLSPEPTARMGAIGAELAKHDLDAISFQEVWSQDGRDVLVKAGLEVGLRYSWYPDRQVGGGGLLVLSKHPIVQAKLVRYALRGRPERVDHGEYYGAKGYAQLRLDTPSGPITLIDTHLHARYASDVGHEYVPHRIGQVAQLALAANTIDDPLVVVGDFNFTDSNIEYGVLTGLSRLRDTAAEVDSRAATVSRENPFRQGSRKPDRRVDYVFSRDGESGRWQTRGVESIYQGAPEGLTGYSNHAGVLAEIELTRESGTLSLPDVAAVKTAREFLELGSTQAQHRRAGERFWTGAGLGCAGLAAISERSVPAMNRRRLLRGGMQLLTLAALAPSVGCTVLSEVFIPDELAAFDNLGRNLAQLEIRLRNGDYAVSRAPAPSTG